MFIPIDIKDNWQGYNRVVTAIYKLDLTVGGGGSLTKSLTYVGHA